jgi:heat shock protein HslJ
MGRMLILASLAWALAAQETVTVTGVLNRVMAIGGESTGWALQLEEESKLDGKPTSEMEVAFPNQSMLREWNGKRVKVTGRSAKRSGVERGERTVLEIATIGSAPIQRAAAGAGLAGTKWLLEDLAGVNVVAGTAATLEFPSATEITGNASCNGFGGTVKIDASSILIREIRMTRKACAAELMRQERRYLELLGAAERWEIVDGKLALHARGIEKPLRFLKSDKL